MAFSVGVGVSDFSVAALAVAPVRSGLIWSQCSPPSVVFITYCMPMNSASFSIGDMTSIGVHGARYLRLRYHDALSIATQFLCQRLAAYERDVHEYGIQFHHSRKPDEVTIHPLSPPPIRNQSVAVICPWSVRLMTAALPLSCCAPYTA